MIWKLPLSVLAVSTVVYAFYAAQAWLRYGKPQPPNRQEQDALLDLFIPVYDVVERHFIAVDAPASTTFAVAYQLDLLSTPLVHLILRTREVLLRASTGHNVALRQLVPSTKAMGWRMLAEVPGREIVMGAATQPWESNVVFRPIPAEEFLAFQNPAYVKIVWTLRADAVTADTSIFRTETRVKACGPFARAKFRRYWTFLSIGIVIIRRVTLGPLKREAERQHARSK